MRPSGANLSIQIVRNSIEVDTKKYYISQKVDFRRIKPRWFLAPPCANWDNVPTAHSKTPGTRFWVIWYFFGCSSGSYWTIPIEVLVPTRPSLAPAWTQNPHQFRDMKIREVLGSHDTAHHWCESDYCWWPKSLFKWSPEKQHSSRCRKPSTQVRVISFHRFFKMWINQRLQLIYLRTMFRVI